MHEISPHGAFTHSAWRRLGIALKIVRASPTLTNPTIKSHCPTDRLGFYCFLLQETKETVNNTASGHQARLMMEHCLTCLLPASPKNLAKLQLNSCSTRGPEDSPPGHSKHGGLLQGGTGLQPGVLPGWVKVEHCSSSFRAFRNQRWALARANA